MESTDETSQLAPRTMSYVGIVARGLCMGIADVIPGVSGGTVALVTGIYRRLITCISHFDNQLIHLLLKRKFSEAANHIDVWFLLALGGGIAGGFVLGVKFVAGLLESDVTRPFVLAAFMGMIVAAAWIVFKSVLKLGNQNLKVDLLAVLVGIAVAALITHLAPSSGEQVPPLWYLFASGAVGICAMILPGVSGAAMLILLGVYQYLIAVAKEVTSFERILENVPVVVCFGLGCLVGLGTSTRIVRRLLERRPGPTLAFLCGLMLGSLPLLWPFQVYDTSKHGLADFKSRLYVAVWPEQIDWQVAACALTAIVALGSVIAAERLASHWAMRTSTARKGPSAQNE